MEEGNRHVFVLLEILMQELERDSAGFKIQKVPEYLRTKNVKAYEPQIIAIGPLNRHLLSNKTRLKQTENHKVLYLKKLLHRRREDFRDVGRYLMLMRSLERRARCCYAEPLRDMLPSAFVKMMVLDACFIVELFRKCKLDLWDNDDDFRICYVHKKLGRDLLLADNQLPFFVLQTFYDVTKMDDDPEINFPDLILHFFNKVLPVQPLNVPQNVPDLDRTHLLGFMYKYYLGLGPLQVLPDAKNWNFIISATNLKEAGVKFEKIEGDSLFSIDFNKDAGIMNISALTIDDDTESLLLNIFVYEQFFPFDVYAPSINYLKFMDCLINTAKDVELLCKNKILHNCLGDNEMVANMFNRLGDSVSLPLHNLYGDIIHNVNDYCDRLWNRWIRHWNRWIANLRHNYFNTPWSIISVFAALFLLILTLIQTLFSVVAYFR